MSPVRFLRWRSAVSAAGSVFRSLGIRPVGGGGNGDIRPWRPPSSRPSSSSSSEKTGLGSRSRFLGWMGRAAGSTFSRRMIGTAGTVGFLSSLAAGTMGSIAADVATTAAGMIVGDGVLFSRLSEEYRSDLLLDLEELFRLLLLLLILLLLLLLDVPLVLLLFPSPLSFPLLLLLLFFDALFSGLDLLLLCFSSGLAGGGAAVVASCRVGVASWRRARTRGSRILGSLLSLSSAACNQGGESSITGGGHTLEG